MTNLQIFGFFRRICYDQTMKKIFLLLTSLLFLAVPLFYVQASGTTDITKPDFRINLQNMNPVQASQATSGTTLSSTTSGK